MLHGLESLYGCRDNASTAKAFLQATAKGYEYAASHPEEAAKILCSEVARDTSSQPLPTPLDPDMVLQSQQILSEVRAPDNISIVSLSPVRHRVCSLLSIVSCGVDQGCQYMLKWSLPPAAAADWQEAALVVSWQTDVMMARTWHFVCAAHVTCGQTQVLDQ